MCAGAHEGGQLATAWHLTMNVHLFLFFRLALSMPCPTIFFINHIQKWILLYTYMYTCMICKLVIPLGQFSDIMSILKNKKSQIQNSLMFSMSVLAITHLFYLICVDLQVITLEREWEFKPNKHPRYLLRFTHVIKEYWPKYEQVQLAFYISRIFL